MVRQAHHGVERLHPTRIHLIPIGNSKGVRLPQPLLQKYGFQDDLLLEEKPEGILIRKRKKDNKLSWADTYKKMAVEKKAWDDLDGTLLDGIEGEEF